MTISLLNTPRRKLFTFFSAFLFAQLIVFISEAQTFTPGNLAVLKVGDGVAPLSASAAQMSVVEYTTSGAATGTVIDLPSTGSPKITASGVATGEGMMTLSAERDRLILPGYDADAGTSSVAVSASGTTNRELFVMTSSGSAGPAAYSTTAYDGISLYSGTALGDNYFSAGPTDGVMLYGTAPIQLTTNPTDIRVVQIFNGQTYFSSNASGFSGVSTLGTGIPITSGQTSTLVTSPTSSAWGFSISPDSSILYIADDALGVLRFVKTGGSYIADYIVNSTPVMGMAVDYSGANPLIYATTTATSGNAIVKITDVGLSSSSTAIATAPANTVFRGITFSPACSASISVIGTGTICSGDSVYFTINGNPSAMVTYNISGGAPLSAVIGVNGKVTISSGMLTANATINLVSITTPACATTPLTGSISITVKTAPTPITGSSNVCLGLTTDLGEALPGGTWSSSSSTTASVGTSGTVTGADIGTATITYTLPNTCYATKDITVNPIPPAITGNFTVCTGISTTLSNTADGTWSSSNSAIANIGSLSGIITGSVTTTSTATITYATGAGCTTTAEVTVYPVSTPITGSTAVCVGSVITLSNATTGGTWASSNTSIATIGTSGIVSGVLAGTTLISYTLPGGCVATKVVTVRPLPLPITGGSTVCVGSTLALHNATAAPNMWSAPGATGVATITTAGLVTGVGVGTADVTFTLTTTGCYTNIVVTVNPVPAAITGLNKVCKGLTIALNDVTPGGTWQSSTTIYATVGSTTGIVTGVNGGTVKISYTLNTGCRQTMQVTVNPIPATITGITNVCAGSTVTLATTSTGGTWSVSNASAIINPATGVLTGVSAGTNTVSYTFASGCTTTTTITVNGLPAAISGPASICAGLMTTLNSTPAGGTWSSSVPAVAAIGSSDGVVSGLTMGTSLITYTLPTGCKTLLLFSVNVSPADITGPTNACLGGPAIILSNISGGGLWTSGNTAIATIGGGTGIVNAIATGTASITYSLYDGCYSTYSISVNVTPAPIAGATTICNGITTLFTDATTGGSWSSASMAVSVGSSAGDVTGVAAGTAIITYSMPSGCFVTKPMTIQISPVPVTGPTAFCMGTTATLTDATFGGTWSSSNVAVAGIGSSTGNVTGISAGTATMSYTIANGCFRTATITMNPLPAPISGIASICVGASLTLSDATAGGEWNSGNELVATIGSGTGMVSGIEPGTSKITYTLPTGCRVTAIMTVAITPSVIAGPVVLCKHSDISLVNATGGGIWTSSNTAVAAPGTSVSTALCILNGVDVGTATITYAIGACIATHDVSVSPLPSVITGTKIVCSELSTALADSVAGGEWNSGDPTVASVDLSGVVTGIAAGTVIITYSIDAICMATAVVTVSQSAPFAHIVVKPAGPLCINTLNQNFGSDIAQPAGADFQWSVTNARLDAVGLDNQYSIISFLSAGQAVIRLSSQIPGTGCVRTDSVVTSVSTGVAPFPKVIYYNNDLVFLDNTVDFYQWGYDDRSTLDSTAALSAWNQDYYLPNPDYHKYAYWVISKHGECMQKTYFRSGLGVNNSVAEADINIYPNPAKTELNVEMTGKDLAEIRVIDAAGKTVYSSMLKNGKETIAVTDFTPGAYMVIVSENGVMLASRAFIKE